MLTTFPPGALAHAASAVPVVDWEQAADTKPNALPSVTIRQLQPTLCILTAGVFAGIEIPVDRTLRIGRDFDNDIRMPSDIAMSRHHARIVPSNDCLLVEDLGSRNGSFVNGAKVERAPLNHNDRLRIGDTLIQVRYQVRRQAAMTSSQEPLAVPGTTLGSRLRTWRKAQGLTQTELASRLGISQRTVSLWEQGAVISVENLKHLREKLGFTPGE